MQMCRIFHPDPPSPPQHLGIKTSRTHEGENTCLTCCHRGLKREPRSSRAHRATYYYYKDSGIQTDGPSETSVSACVTEERLMLHFRTDVCGSRKPSEINSKKHEKLLKLKKKMCEASFLVDGFHAVIIEDVMEN